MVATVVLDVRLRQVRLAGEIARDHAVQPPRLARGLDVPLELRGFLGEFVGSHHETVDEGRVDAGGHHGRAHVDADREQGGAPQPRTPRAPQHQRSAHQGGQRRQPQAGQRAVQVREARAHQRPGGGLQEPRHAHQVHAQRCQHEQGRNEHGEVQPCARLHGDAPAIHGDVAPQHVKHHASGKRNSREDCEQAQHVGDHRQREHVVRDVAPEHRVGGSKRNLVDETKHVEPRTRGGRARHDRHQQHQRPRHAANQPHQFHRSGGRDLDYVGRQFHPAQREPQVGVQHRKHHHRHREAEHRTGDEAGGEHAREAELLEPRPFRQKTDQRGNQEDGDKEEDEQAGASRLL